MRNPIGKCIAGTAAATATALAMGVSTAGAAPQVELLPHSFAAPPTSAQCETTLGIACYNASQFEQAYGTNQLYSRGVTGKGQTIVIVDSFGSPNIQQDLNTFDQQSGLPAPPSFEVIDPVGAPPPYDPTNADQGGWALESTLDVEMAHTMAPQANILLVETPVDETEGVTGLPEMMNAEKFVVDHHLGEVISQSFAATEQTFANPFQIQGLRYAFEDAAAHGVTVLGATGDAGASNEESNLTDFYPFPVTAWPATDPLVTAVGGTQLHLATNGDRVAPDNVWNDTALLGSPASGGGGLSTVFQRPFFQNGVASTVRGQRGIPDVSASAAVNGADLVYLSVVNGPEGLTGPGWYPVGGTSEATPLLSGIVALADQVAHHPLGNINPALYAIGGNPFSSGLTDITSGDNGVTFTNSDGTTHTVAGFDAGRGYDLASGLGTPNAPSFVFQLASAAR